MDRRTMDRVFEPFFTTKRPGTGTGLGLAVVHSIMKEHDGAVLIDSAVGQGTVVQCYFPGIMSGAQDRDETPEQCPRGNGQRILYVEDEPLLSRLGSRRLEGLGYRVTVATDPREALSRIQSQPEVFDAVITDYWMPNLTGLDLAHEIHGTKPEIPIIMLTGFQEDLPDEMLSSRGIRRVLGKPTTIQELALALHMLLQGG
jgi:CheY-like chemotaxis protein